MRPPLEDAETQRAEVLNPPLPLADADSSPGCLQSGVREGRWREKDKNFEAWKGRVTP